MWKSVPIASGCTDLSVVCNVRVVLIVAVVRRRGGTLVWMGRLVRLLESVGSFLTGQSFHITGSYHDLQTVAVGIDPVRLCYLDRVQQPRVVVIPDRSFFD